MCAVEPQPGSCFLHFSAPWMRTWPCWRDRLLFKEDRYLIPLTGLVQWETDVLFPGCSANHSESLHQVIKKLPMCRTWISFSPALTLLHVRVSVVCGAQRCAFCTIYPVSLQPTWIFPYHFLFQLLGKREVKNPQFFSLLKNRNPAPPAQVQLCREGEIRGQG